MNRLDKFVPSRERCLKMVEIPALNQLLKDTFYIWGAAGVQMRTGSYLAIPAPMLQEMQQLLKSYDATMEESGRFIMTISGWIMTVIIDNRPIRCYHIDNLDEMALACIELVKGLSEEK